MTLPGRHSLFWKLAMLLLGVCVLIAWGAWYWGGYFERSGSFLSEAGRQQMRAYAAEAEQAWSRGGREGVDQWLARMAVREPDSWAAVVDENLQSLGSRPLGPDDFARMKMLRHVDGQMSKRAKGVLYLSLPFPHAPQAGHLAMRLPKRFVPEGFGWSAHLLVHGVAPGVMALLLGIVLYRLLIAPLGHLREQANALRGDRLGTRVAREVSTRKDELGELGLAFDHMAGRLESTVAFQRQLLRDLSHELRTPLSRLRVAGESAEGLDALRQRLEREVRTMDSLVNDTLELVWLDTDRPRLSLVEVEVASLWEVLRENASFEAGWEIARMPCELASECRIRGHLNGLAQALENILRNAIRHSPEGGRVSLGGRREEGHWHLWVDDEGPGVADSQLEAIFMPFTRLAAARPGGDGFGLGLSIARSMVQLQGGELWAENLGTGLRMNLRLQTYGSPSR